MRRILLLGTALLALGLPLSALSAVAQQLPAPPEDDCGCDPPAAKRSSLQGGAETVQLGQPEGRVPATMVVERDGAILRLEADTIAGMLDDGPLEAQGGVVATYGDLRLQADWLRFDRLTGEGLASGSVSLSRPPHRLLAESLVFDLDAGTAEASRWRGWIEGQVQAEGRLLTMNASRSVAYDVSLSPCLAEDPGYRFDFAELEWVSLPGGDSLSGWNSILRLSGLPVFWLPYFQTTFSGGGGEAKGPKIRHRLRGGYDGFDGFYLTTSGDYELAPGWTGNVPIRATAQRGVTLGIEQRLPLEVAEGRLDAFYTTPFPGNVQDFLPGPRVNLSFLRDLPGGSGGLSMGYRVDVGNPFRIGPTPFLSSRPVSRFPEFSYAGISRQAGPLRWSPSARLGYLVEEGGASSPLAELALGGGGPEFWLPGGIRVGTFGSLRGNAYRELSGAERAAGGGFLGRMARGVGQAGLSASTELWGFQLGGSAELVRVVSGTPNSPVGTPFAHDAIASQDRLSGGARRHLYGPLSGAASAVLAQPHDARGSLGWVTSDVGLSLSYEVNCVGVHFNYQPLIKGWSFSYVVTSF